MQFVIERCPNAGIIALDQAAAFPTVKGLNLPELTLQYATSPLHPGAIRYYEEIGLTVPDHLK